MSLKKWFKIRRLSGLFGFWSVVLFILVFVIMIIVSPPDPNQTEMSSSEAFFIIVWAVLGSCAIGCLMYYEDYNRKIRKLQKHLNEDNLRLYFELSPSQMEDMCLRRLKVLGYVWDEAIKNYPKPFAKERAEAESAFRRAYWFFEENKCIKPTNWDPFFPQPKTQK